MVAFADAGAWWLINRTEAVVTDVDAHVRDGAVECEVSGLRCAVLAPDEQLRCAPVRTSAASGELDVEVSWVLDGTRQHASFAVSVDGRRR